MSTETEYLDDASIEDPWERLANTDYVPGLLAEARDLERLTEYRRLVESLEQRLKEDQT